jgi:hypothetical protein
LFTILSLFVLPIEADRSDNRSPFTELQAVNGNSRKTVPAFRFYPISVLSPFCSKVHKKATDFFLGIPRASPCLACFSMICHPSLCLEANEMAERAFSERNIEDTSGSEEMERACG